MAQGSLFNYHPHLHALVPAGIMKDGVFYEQKNISTSVIAEIFRARLLAVLLEQGVIRQELINMLMCWNHHSGFNVHVRGQIDGADGDVAGAICGSSRLLQTTRPQRRYSGILGRRPSDPLP